MTCWNRKGPSASCSQKIESIIISKMSFSVITIPLELKNTEKQSHPIIPSALTLNWTQSTLLVTAKPRLIHVMTRQKGMICHYRVHVCTALESSDSMLAQPHEVWRVVAVDSAES
ncbi:hypothetical protein ATANTOWER_004791 [Ataeniobius toweri]|uniref:Uncharacterized protein n=1 Tax=Ataeniobius toweri TaxID=208326 RepID=A0ABU7BYW0_9TELE|nr:hypothetical protein [Ataeniobius toweri]